MRRNSLVRQVSGKAIVAFQPFTGRAAEVTETRDGFPNLEVWTVAAL